MGDSISNNGNGAGPSTTQPAGSDLRKELDYLNEEIKYNRSRINAIEGKLSDMEPVGPRRTFSAADPTARTEAAMTDDTDLSTGDYMCLTAEKTYPKVRECNFVEFKNRFDKRGRDGRYAVDVLVSGPLLHQEIQEEHRLRDKLFLKKPPKLSTQIVSDKSMKKAVKLANANVELITQVQSDEMKWPRRIRLQSPALIRMLARANRERWTDRQRTYYRPFNALIYHHPKMKEILEELEERYGAELDGAETAENDDDDQEEESAPTDDGDDEESDEVVDSPKALLCLRAYVKYMEERILPDYHRFEKMDVKSNNANVRFSDLWYLFRTGELVYRQVDGELPDRRDFRTGKRIWMTFYVDPIPEREMAAFTDDDEIRDTATKNDERTFRLGCYYIDYNGEEFCCVKTEVKIEQFSGEMPINSLPIYPMRFCRDWKSRLDHAKKTGDDLIEFIQKKHCSYNGWTLTRDPSGEPTTDAKGKILEQPEHINSEVMVDFGEAFQQCPQWRPPRASMREKIVDGLTLPEEFKIRWWSGEDRSVLLGETTEQIPVRSGVTWKQRNTFVGQDPFLSKVSDNVKRLQQTTVEHLSLGSDTKALLTGRVFAYVFQERKFAQLAVAKLRPSPKTGLPLSSLKIPQAVKHAIQGSIQGHFRQKNAERKIDQDWVSLDLIEGKGSGLFILLHGVPGVGKTATAEAIAKANGKPLFKITVGDLGMTPENLETSLREIFRLASIWDCILLLDEVDTFFSARSRADTATTKNGLVSEFLRVLDYYDGILFLTTNRAGVLDEAFKSRIHYKIYYPNLSLEQTMDIWKLNIQRTRQIEEELCKAEGRAPLQINEQELLNFARAHFDQGVKDGKGGHWNGRQIRNAFQVARSLAYYEHGIREEELASTRQYQAAGMSVAGAPAEVRDGGVMLSGPPTMEVGHFKTMHDITASFEKYCNSTRGGATDSEIAHDNEYRHDGFQDTLTENLRNDYKEDHYRAASAGGTTTDIVTDVRVHQHQHQQQYQQPQQQPQHNMYHQPNWGFQQPQQPQQQQQYQQQQYQPQIQTQASSSNFPPQNSPFLPRNRSNSHLSNTGAAGSSPPNIVTFDPNMQQQQPIQGQQQQRSLFPGSHSPRHTPSRESLIQPGSGSGNPLNLTVDPAQQGQGQPSFPNNIGRPRSGTGNTAPGGIFPGQSRSVVSPPGNNNNNNNPNMIYTPPPSQSQLAAGTTPRGPSPGAINIPTTVRDHRDSFESGGSGGAGSYGQGGGGMGMNQGDYTLAYGSSPGPQAGGQFAGGGGGGWNAGGGQQQGYSPGVFGAGMGGHHGGNNANMRSGGGGGGGQHLPQQDIETDLPLDDGTFPLIR